MSSTRQKGQSQNCYFEKLQIKMFLQLIFSRNTRPIIFGVNHALYCYFHSKNVPSTMLVQEWENIGAIALSTMMIIITSIYDTVEPAI